MTLTDENGDYRAPDDSDDSDSGEYVAHCPACGEPIDYCQGHGEIGDPVGAAILAAHDDGDHSRCHPAGCDDIPAPLQCDESDLSL